MFLKFITVTVLHGLPPQFNLEFCSVLIFVDENPNNYVTTEKQAEQHLLVVLFVCLFPCLVVHNIFLVF